jgi:hypothetical protein
MLFGKKCRLVGAGLTKVQLQSIHSVSPEKVPLAFSGKQVQEALDQFNEIKKGTLPAQLEVYFDRVKKRLTALSVFYAALDEARNNNKPDVILTKVQPHIGTHSLTELKVQIDKLSANWNDSTLRDQAIDVYQKMIEPDPEAEFHRVIKRMKVSYACRFEEED